MQISLTRQERGLSGGEGSTACLQEQKKVVLTTASAFQSQKKTLEETTVWGVF